MDGIIHVHLHENFGIPSRWNYFHGFLSVQNVPGGTYSYCHIPHTPGFRWGRLVPKCSMFLAQNGFLDGILCVCEASVLLDGIFKKSTPKTFAKEGVCATTYNHPTFAQHIVAPWPPLPIAISLAPQLPPFQPLGR